jgi:uncharacterized membrane protein YeaQ/YmgE (transglycosylase-associated protein family)
MFLALFILLVALFIVFPVIGMSAWGLISTIIVGLIIGSLGRLVVPGSRRLGFVYTLMAGLVGSIVGGFLGDHVFGLSWFPTVLIEIGVAAVGVAVLRSTKPRMRLPGTRGRR